MHENASAILVLGNQESTKRELFTKIFGVDLEKKLVDGAFSSSHNIEQELGLHGQNSRLAIHTCLNFGNSDDANYDRVRDFLISRVAFPTKQEDCASFPPVCNRLHPAAPGVPLVFVFTKYDEFVSQVKLDWSRDAEERRLSKVAVSPIRRDLSSKKFNKHIGRKWDEPPPPTSKSTPATPANCTALAYATSSPTSSLKGALLFNLRDPTSTLITNPSLLPSILNATFDASQRGRLLAKCLDRGGTEPGPSILLNLTPHERAVLLTQALTGTLLFPHRLADAQWPQDASPRVAPAYMLTPAAVTWQLDGIERERRGLLETVEASTLFTTCTLWGAVAELMVRAVERADSRARGGAVAGGRRRRHAGEAPRAIVVGDKSEL
ncbi:hypothetical protein C8A01DRAFT_31954 [Parachaetomium inaequale]|uniref:Uncharacterized protein n=1 Tax=Parachaetomium inaequale TaxID=2588326 RepID=A0AAN6PMN1_9PEZI|nr:hypothetical protein C8A01DRAFT_31954 [Parachaetomium inaequale]